MAKKRINITGQKIGRLTALEFCFVKNGKSHWKFICDCGMFVTKIATYVTSNRILSCGCLAKENGIERMLKINAVKAINEPGTLPIKSILHQYLKNSKQRGLNFEIALVDFKKLIISNCYYCAAPPSNHLKLKVG